MYLLLLLLGCNTWLRAGGSGLNVVVVVNQNSANSVQLGNYYCEQRQIPPQNLLRVNWTGGKVQWTKSEFESTVLNPLLTMLAQRQLTNQVDYVVLSMDLPYRVVHSGSPSESGINSTTSALFYGFKPDFALPSFSLASCNLPSSSSNAYAGSEGIFRATPPTTATSNYFMVTMLTSSNLAQAKQLVDRAIASDGAFPTQTVYLAHSDDRLRNLRYWLFDDAIFNTRLRGNYSMRSTNANDPNSLGSIAGFQAGVASASIANGIFTAGAIADTFTSFAGYLFEQNGQIKLLDFLNAGAAGSYGTVVEPCAWLQKFPAPQNYFYQARGFTLAESYYQSVTNPHQGVLVGEPLAAPFAQPPFAAWNNLPPDALLSGTTNLSVTISAAGPHRPISQVDLFLDGRFLSTLTNIAPRQNNALNVTINGHAMNHSVPASATIKSVVTGLTAVLNQTANTNATKVRAFAHGDRIELRSLDLTRPGAQTPASVSNSIGTGSALTTWISTPTNHFLDTTAHGLRSFVLTNLPPLNAFLELIVVKTNGQTIVTSVTNQTSGVTLADFARSLFNLVNSRIELLGPDGIVIEDVNMHEDPPFNEFIYGTNDHSGEFNIRARSPGWTESQIQVRLRGSPAFGIQPSGTNRLDESLGDLQPRTHLYIHSGLTNLTLNFPLNTATLPDGFHELTAVVYEGSHVRTQKRVSQRVRFQNNGLSALFIPAPLETNAALSSLLQFSIVANMGNISRIELFSTGGPLTNVTGQSSAIFSVAGTHLGVGLHPFYAIITATGGLQYRTETRWIRLVEAQPPFFVAISPSPSTLHWPAVPGQRYEILSATNMGEVFALRAELTASNSFGQWVETNSAAPQRFYRIRTAD